MAFDWLSLGAEVLGGILGKGASSAMDLKASEKLIEKQLEAQKDLFAYENQNKHQFEVGDLRAAGLNPVLSATHGNAVGVGGVSAPNWSSDDDIVGPASARAMQRTQLGIQDQQAKAQLLSAEAAMQQAKNGLVSSSAKARLDNTSADIAWMKADAEVKALYQALRESDSRIKLNAGKWEEALSAAQEHRAGAKDKIESAIGRKISNEEENFVLDLINDPDLQGTPTRTALILAKKLNLNTSERVGLVAAITGHKFRHDPPAVVNESNSAASAFDDIIQNYVD